MGPAVIPQVERPDHSGFINRKNSIVLTPDFTRRDLHIVTTPRALAHGRELAAQVEGMLTFGTPHGSAESLAPEENGVLYADRGVGGYPRSRPACV